MPIYLGGGLVALAIIGVVLAVAAMSDREPTAEIPAPTPSVAAPSESTPAPLPTSTPTQDPNAPATPDASEPDVTPEPPVDVTPSPQDATTEGEFTGDDGDYTIIIASKTSESKANRVSESATSKGYTTAVLSSDNYSSLNGGYWVVYSGAYANRSDAVDELASIKSDYADAYVMQIKQ